MLSNNSKLVGCVEIPKSKKGEESELITTHFQTFNLADCVCFNKVYGFYLHTSSFLWRNIFPQNVPPFPDRFYKIKGDPALMILMMGKKFSIHRLDETISAYRITGQGRWSRLSEKEQLELNNVYEKIRSFWPLRQNLIYDDEISSFD